MSASVRLVLLLSNNKYSKDNCPFELVKLKEELLSDIFLHSTQYIRFLSPSYDRKLYIRFHLSWIFRCSGNLSYFVSVSPTCPSLPLKHYFCWFTGTFNFSLRGMVVAELYRIFSMLIDREQEKSDKTRNIMTDTTMSIIESHLIY